MGRVGSVRTLIVLPARDSGTPQSHRLLDRGPPSCFDNSMLVKRSAPVTARASQHAALPLHVLIVRISGCLSFACVLGGITGIYSNAKADTKLDIFGAHLSTGHVGVAFVGIGLIIGLFTV